MAHLCPVPKCRNTIHSNSGDQPFVCAKHWRRVPEALRDEWWSPIQRRARVEIQQEILAGLRPLEVVVGQ